MAVASFGEKNAEYLRRVIERYRALPMHVHVVVLSEAPKQLGAGVEARIGLPARNPWSLPFAHKQIFAERIGLYDLFAFSEDDMDVTEANIQAFLQATSALASDEIAGFLRFETGPDGAWSLPEVHGSYHWRPESVRARGPYTVAEFTNEHSGFFILTQAQLRQAIASGGFLRAPHEGRYGLLETAATDPYTSCGFRKVLCVSHMGEFFIHHMSNRYAGQLGLSLSAFKEQLETLMQIGCGRHPATTLCRTESNMPRNRWSKSYYEQPCSEVLRLLPNRSKQVLSIGCGWGATEAKLRERNVEVTALPLDSVIGPAAAKLGVEAVYGTLNECFERLAGRTFDCVLITNLLHLLAQPWSLLEACAPLAKAEGSVVIAGPNFDFLKVWLRRAFAGAFRRKLRSFNQSGISVCGPSGAARHLSRLGFSGSRARWLSGLSAGGNRGIPRPLRRLAARGWALHAWRSVAR
ncbi:MAG: methyltransferase domain-containing protein [Verrucomicrobiota bacterium]